VEPLKNDRFAISVFLLNYLEASSKATAATLALGNVPGNTKSDSSKNVELQSKVVAQQLKRGVLPVQGDVDLHCQILSAMTNLLADSVHRAQFVGPTFSNADSQNQLNSGVVSLKSLFRYLETVLLMSKLLQYSYQSTEAEICEKVLGLVLNVTVESSTAPILIESCPNIIEDLMAISVSCDNRIISDRAHMLLSRLLRVPQAQQCFIQRQGILFLMNNIAQNLSIDLKSTKKSTVILECSVRALAILIDHKEVIEGVTSFTTHIVDEKGENFARTVDVYSIMHSLLLHQNKQVCGNAAPIISALAKADKKIISKLHQCVVPLIELMKSNDAQVSQNAAIACARLASDPQNLAKIRELNAMEIMFVLSNRISKK
jgi:hypothetical protein